MQRLALDGAFMWSVWQPDRAMHFNSYLFVRPEGNVAVDPLRLSDEDRAEIERLGGVSAIVVTNRDHLRETEALRAWSGARVICSAAEAPLLPFAPDATVGDGDVIFGMRVVTMAGAKTPGEIALVLRREKTAIVGDAILGTPAGGLSFLPEAKLSDAAALALSLRRLWAQQLNVLLVGDGAPLFSGADAAIGALLETAAGPSANRINVRDLHWKHDGPNGKYEADDAEIGLLIGARRLGYRLARLQPGAAYCPLHAHDLEEEFFYVVDGTPSIRTPRGTIVLQTGDFIAFPTGDRGAHQLLNESDAPSTLLLVGNAEPGEVCFYPDSRKVMLDSRDLIVRTEPALDYFDGE